MRVSIRPLLELPGERSRPESTSRFSLGTERSAAVPPPDSPVAFRERLERTAPAAMEPLQAGVQVTGTHAWDAVAVRWDEHSALAPSLNIVHHMDERQE